MPELERFRTEPEEEPDQPDEELTKIKKRIELKKLKQEELLIDTGTFTLENLASREAGIAPREVALDERENEQEQRTGELDDRETDIEAKLAEMDEKHKLYLALQRDAGRLQVRGQNFISIILEGVAEMDKLNELYGAFTEHNTPAKGLLRVKKKMEDFLK